VTVKLHSNHTLLFSVIGGIAALAVLLFAIDVLPLRYTEPDFVYVSGGKFTMGSTGEQGNYFYNDEKPAHQVKLRGFYLCKYEVTQAQWKEVMGYNPSEFKGDSLPVERVNWYDTQRFIKKLNAKTGKKYRLPTEAEWEYAARGSTKSSGYVFSGSNAETDVAWYWHNALTTHPVGTKQANELGIYDMSGNVYEWCSDWYDAYSSSSQTDPQGASQGLCRVSRGGSWVSSARYLRVSFRLEFKPDDRRNYIGFRLAY
jgi:formylglycine-generating enzyme required for sulfatase activity